MSWKMKDGRRSTVILRMWEVNGRLFEIGSLFDFVDVANFGARTIGRVGDGKQVALATDPIWPRQNPIRQGLLGAYTTNELLSFLDEGRTIVVAG